nr:immunoglobulin light chain junction region [Macaca mulatta]
YMQGLEFPPSF